jgi:hypothetical protein
VLACFAFVWLAGAQQPSAEPAAAVFSGSRHYPPYLPAWHSPEGQPLPFRTDEEVLEFLAKARVGRMRGIPEGITAPSRVVLERNGVKMHAIFRAQRVERLVMQLADGTTEMHFRDDCLFEVAAFELSRMLGLNNVPPTVVRVIHGQKGSLQTWIENAMTDKSRRAKGIAPPDTEYYNRQYVRMQFFDNLIYNSDRNQGNILLGPDWRLWMIDHTRAFRRHAELRQPEAIRQCERKLFERLKSLDEKEVRRRLRPYLRPAELDGLLARRLLLIAHVETLVAERGPERVFFELD